MGRNGRMTTHVTLGRVRAGDCSCLMTSPSRAGMAVGQVSETAPLPEAKDFDNMFMVCM